MFPEGAAATAAGERQIRLGGHAVLPASAQLSPGSTKSRTWIGIHQGARQKLSGRCRWGFPWKDFRGDPEGPINDLDIGKFLITAVKRLSVAPITAVDGIDAVPAVNLPRIGSEIPELIICHQRFFPRWPLARILRDNYKNRECHLREPHHLSRTPGVAGRRRPGRCLRQQ